MFTYENLNFLVGYNAQTAGNQANWLITFLTGGCSKSLASATLLPINVVRTRLQSRAYTHEEVSKFNLKDIHTNDREHTVYDGIVDCVKKTYRQEGIPAFYKGLTPLILKVFPTSGLFFLTYEGTLKLLNRHSRE